MKTELFPLLAAVFLTACQVEYHPYDTRIDGPTGVNARNIARIEAACEGRRTIRFAQISDTQRWYDETEDAVKAINARDDIDFVIHTGDLADFGMRDEFERQRDILDRLRVPYVVLLGNHDCLATGERIFTKIFGEVDFAFTAGDVRFVCLNTNALEFDHDTPVPNFDFLERQIDGFPAGAEKTVVVMHAKPYSERGQNLPTDDPAVPAAAILPERPRAPFRRRGSVRRRRDLLRMRQHRQRDLSALYRYRGGIQL